MTSNLSTLRSLVAIGALAVAASTLPLAHADADSARKAASVKPMAGLMLDAGTKHAVGYFLAADGGCSVTLLVADAATPEQPVVPSTPARFNAHIDAGRTARIDTVDGPSIEFKCAEGAAAMEARVVERLAYVPPAK